LTRELVSPRGVQRKEDARNLTSLRARRRSPGGQEQPPGGRRRKISAVPPCPGDPRSLAEKTVEVRDAARFSKCFWNYSQGSSGFSGRLPRRRRPRAASPRTPRSPPLAHHLNPDAGRSRCFANSPASLWKDRASCIEQDFHSNSALRPSASSRGWRHYPQNNTNCYFRSHASVFFANS